MSIILTGELLPKKMWFWYSIMLEYQQYCIEFLDKVLLWQMALIADKIINMQSVRGYNVLVKVGHRVILWSITTASFYCISTCTLEYLSVKYLKFTYHNSLYQM